MLRRFWSTDSDTNQDLRNSEVLSKNKLGFYLFINVIIIIIIIIMLLSRYYYY